MKTRKLGYSDLELTTVGLGTWAHGGGGWSFSWGPQDDELSIQTIHTALEAGINWIDAAAVYGLGHAEEVLVATKCGLVWDDMKRISGYLLSESIRAECENSLQRLQLDVIDLYQIHWPNPDEQIEEGWYTMKELVEEGKIRYAGVSNFSVEHMKRCQAIHPIASLQPPYSMLTRGIEKDSLKYCEENNIGVLAYSPLQKGLLTGKMTLEYIEAMADDDHRKTKDPMFQEPALSEILEHVDKLRAIAGRNNITLTQLAIAWVLRRPELTAAIVGCRSPEQVTGAAPAMDVELSGQDITAIDEVLNN